MVSIAGSTISSHSLPMPSAQPSRSSVISNEAISHSAPSRKCSLWRVVGVVAAIAAVIFAGVSNSSTNSLSIIDLKRNSEPPFFANETRAVEMDLEISKNYSSAPSFVDVLIRAIGEKNFTELQKTNKLGKASITSSGIVVDPKAMTSPVMIGEWNNQPYFAFKYKNLETGSVSVGSIFYYKSITWLSSNAPFRIGTKDDLSALQAFNRLVNGYPCEFLKDGKMSSFKLTNENCTTV